MVATIYQGNHDRKKQALGCRINLQIYTPYAGAARIFININGKFIIGKFS
jgi:hypothetical protein